MTGCWSAGCRGVTAVGYARPPRGEEDVVDESLEVVVMFTGMAALFLATLAMGIAAARSNRD